VWVTSLALCAALAAEPEESAWTAEQVMFTFAIVAYKGQSLDGNTLKDEAKTAEKIRHGLTHQPTLNGEWELVWGPAIAKPPGTFIGANLVFVAREIDRPSQLVVGVRGTPNASIYDMLIEVMGLKPVPWEYGDRVANAGKIAHGIDVGLQHIQTLEPCRHGDDKQKHRTSCEAEVPGAGIKLRDFLDGEAKAHPGGLDIAVVGHSLGGPISVTLSQWLHDTRGEAWDRDEATDLHTWTFAAQTAGDADFARYADERIGPNLHRMENSLDMVPLWWDPETLARIPTLYEPCGIHEAAILGPAAKVATAAVEGAHYTHLRADQPSLKGHCAPATKNKKNKKKRAHLLDEVLYQHIEGYAALLELDGVVHLGAATGERPRKRKSTR